MRVIGTAGHVDHGKSTLVEAMTGSHPDRLKEEQEREMTIDLGFAWLKLPEAVRPEDAPEVGIVDVPGHRDFIENMLAGIGGIDAALLVVAADEGVMPQTREHLAILDLLEVRAGIVALTKVDLIQEPEWLDLVEAEVRQALSPTVLAQAPILRVSGHTGQGVPRLVEAIGVLLLDRPPRPDLGRPRLPVDRVFTVAGFGTVVTGTLSDGSLRVGDPVEVYPRELRGRVRGLQSHKRKVEKAEPGGRTAVNVAGVEVEAVERGDVVAPPGAYKPTRRLDARFRLLPDLDLALKHDTEVKLFLGASEVMARLRLLGTKTLSPGETGWVQLELNHPVVAVRGDRYILRRPSPGLTLGGGQVVDPQPRQRHKRFSRDVLARLEALSEGSPAEVLLQAALAAGPAPVREIVRRSNLDLGLAAATIKEQVDTGDLVPLEDGAVDPDADTLLVSQQAWATISERVLSGLAEFQQNNPLRAGMPREELRSRLRMDARTFTAVTSYLSQAGLLVQSGPLLAEPGHEIRFEPAQQEAISRLLGRFKSDPYSPPGVKDCRQAVGDQVFAALVDLGDLVQVAEEVVFRREDYETLKKEVERMIQAGGSVTVAGVRDRFSTSRKYALALLEHLDSVGFTRRVGDERKLA